MFDQSSVEAYQSFNISDVLKKRKSHSALMSKGTSHELEHSGSKSNYSYVSGSSIALNENLRGRLTVTTTQHPYGARSSKAKAIHALIETDSQRNLDLDKLLKLQAQMQ